MTATHPHPPRGRGRPGARHRPLGAKRDGPEDLFRQRAKGSLQPPMRHGTTLASALKRPPSAPIRVIGP